MIFLIVTGVLLCLIFPPCIPLLVLALFEIRRQHINNNSVYIIKHFVENNVVESPVLSYSQLCIYKAGLKILGYSRFEQTTIRNNISKTRLIRI